MAKKKPEKQLDLVGLAEVAEMLGLRRGSVKSRRETHFDTFPEPIAQLACGPIWLRSQIADYVALEERLGHRRTLDAPEIPRRLATLAHGGGRSRAHAPEVTSVSAIASRGRPR